MPSVGSTHPRLSPRLPAPGHWLLPSAGHPIHGPGPELSACLAAREIAGGAVTRSAFSGSLAAFLHLERHSGQGRRGQLRSGMCRC
jgi:hypothetical protein